EHLSDYARPVEVQPALFRGFSNAGIGEGLIGRGRRFLGGKSHSANAEKDSHRRTSRGRLFEHGLGSPMGCRVYHTTFLRRVPLNDFINTLFGLHSKAASSENSLQPESTTDSLS